MARKEKKYHFIYKTTNLLSGRYYIGMHSTDNLEDGYLGSGRRLKYSINKYGKDNFKREILEFCENREELKQREFKIIDLNELSKKECINLVVGGQGGFISLEGTKKGGKKGGSVHAKRLKEDVDYYNRCVKIATNNLLDANKRNNYIVQSFKGKKHSDDTKQKMRKPKNVGDNNPSYGTYWITKDGDNKKIKKEELPIYESEGWVKGRKLK